MNQVLIKCRRYDYKPAKCFIICVSSFESMTAKYKMAEDHALIMADHFFFTCQVMFILCFTLPKWHNVCSFCVMLNVHYYSFFAKSVINVVTYHVYKIASFIIHSHPNCIFISAKSPLKLGYSRVIISHIKRVFYYTICKSWQLQSSAVITRSSITWYCTHYCNDWGRV